MKKYITYLSVIITVLICFTVDAKAQTGTVNGTDVRLRKDASTSSEIVVSSLPDGATLTINSSKSGSGCDADWYNVNYGNYTGYICGEYVNIIYDVTDGSNPTNDYEKVLKEAGFPSSYWPHLSSLHAKHPTWIFKAINTGINFETAIDKESSCGKSLINTKNSSYLDSSCKKKDGPFKAASKTAVAYYMDPRNWLSENTIFQFENLRYENSLSSKYESASLSIIQKDAFYLFHKNNNLPSIIDNAGKKANVSSIFLSSRIHQELGASTSLMNLYSGNGIVKLDNRNYTGYYNFFNIGVTGECNEKYGATYCGLKTAVNKGWNSLDKAILGGANFLGKDYINADQYTIYLQKFNVATRSSNRFLHQYMTNIVAPSSEAKSVYKAYKNAGILDYDFTFYIPVYSNMNTTIENSNSGGTGEDSSNNNEVNIDKVVTSSGYKYSNKFISGIDFNTEISAVTNSLSNNGGNSITITTPNGNVVNSGVLGTGYKITISNGSNSEKLAVVIKGDTSGDGKVNALDLLQVQKQILGAYNLKEENLKAGDTSGDGKVNALDLLQIQKQILGTYDISQ